MQSDRIVEYDSYLCNNCRQFAYNETLGEPLQNIAPHTRVEQLPKSWRCPVCGADKEQLRPTTMIDGA